MHAGKKTRFVLPTARYPAMAWPMEHLGAGAVIYAGSGLKDHVRAAIQILSTDVQEQHVFMHLGWRQIGDEYVYLHAGGAITAAGLREDVRVGVADPISRFVLPAPPTGDELVAAVRASLRFLDLLPDAIAFPLFASLWRAPLGYVDYTPFLVGPTGAGKTEIAALLQQHWGPGLKARRPPANWSSTANANEGIAFIVKDALLVVDDFAPGGGGGDINKLHREADRLLRAAGNSAGRGRMRSDASLRPGKPPRGMILATGEDTPRGQSLRARLLVLELSPDSLNWQRLSDCQRDAAAGTYAAAMSAYLCWLAPQYGDICQERQARQDELRAHAATSLAHRRTPTTIASAYYGLETYMRFAEEVGVLTEAEVGSLLDRAWRSLGDAAEAQGAVQSESDPVQRYAALLEAAVTSGRAHLASHTGGYPVNPTNWGWRGFGQTWEPQGARIGWVHANDLYLDPHAAFAAAQQMARDGMETLAVGQRALTKRLHEGGKLVTIDEQRDRLTIRRTLDRATRSVLHLHTDFLRGVEGSQ